MKSTKRVVAMIIAAMIMIILVGCRSDTEDSRGGEPVGASGVGVRLPEFLYLSEVVPFPKINDDIIRVGLVVLADDMIYFTAWGHGSESSHINLTGEGHIHYDVHGLFSMNVDGTGLFELPNYTVKPLPSEAVYGYATIAAIHVDSEGYLWIAEAVGFYEYDFHEEVDSDDIIEAFDSLVTKTSHYLRKLDDTGAEILSFDISGIAPEIEWFYISEFVVDDAGNMYVVSGSVIYILDDQGRLLFDLDSQDFRTHLVLLSDGSVALVVRQGGNTHLKVIDVERRSWGEIISLPSSITVVHEIFPGNGEFLYLFNDNTYLNGIDAGTGELVRILSWVDSTLSAENIDSVMFLHDDRIAITRQMHNNENPAFPITELSLLTKISYDELPEKAVLTFGTLHYDSSLRFAVEQFNRNSTTHRIHVTDYSEFNTGDDWFAAILRFSTDMIAGNSPDIISFWSQPLQNNASKGLFVDLYPLLDADPDLSRSSFIESTLKAAEIDGSLYRIFTSFSISTLLGHPSVLGEYPGWNMDEFIAVFDANPQADLPLGPWYTDMFMLSIAVVHNIEEYIDRVSGTVDFDNDDFINLLELAKTFPSEFEWDNQVSVSELIATGRTIIGRGLNSFDNFIHDRTSFGGEIVFKGYPSVNRDGNILNPGAYFSISASCADVNAAWEFVRIFLMEDYQRNIDINNSFPVNNVVYEERMQSIMQRVGWHWMTSDGDVIEIDPLTQAEADQIRNLIDNTTRVYSYDDALWDIVRESASDFFNGLITAQDAARVIQSRASIYISEQS